MFSKSSVADLLYVGKGWPFTTCRRILTQKQQTTFELIVAKGEISHLYLSIKLSFMEIFQVFVIMFLKSSAADLLYVGKG